MSAAMVFRPSLIHRRSVRICVRSGLTLRRAVCILHGMFPTSRVYTFISVFCLLFACQPDERLSPGYLCEQDSDCAGFCLHLEHESYCSVACAYGCYDNCDEYNDLDFVMVCEASDQSENGWACVAHPPDYNVPDMSNSCFDPTSVTDPTGASCSGGSPARRRAGRT